MKQNIDISVFHPANIIATFFLVGKVPFAPGTFGSLATYPLFILSHYLLVFADSADSMNNIYMVYMLLLFIIGTLASKSYMKITGREDPKEVVIDEVVGQTIVFFAAFTLLIENFDLFSLSADNPGFVEFFARLFQSQLGATYIIVSAPIYAICFVLFRFFDILKPWPIGWCDRNIKGGFGVMFDDVFAGVYASIVLYGAVVLLTKFIG